MENNSQQKTNPNNGNKTDEKNKSGQGSQQGNQQGNKPSNNKAESAE